MLRHSPKRTKESEYDSEIGSKCVGQYKVKLFINFKSIWT